jgi:hypothetical protein
MMGAGTQESESQLFRVREIAFGPVKATETLVGTMTTPAPGTIGGLLGNELLGSCSAGAQPQQEMSTVSCSTSEAPSPRAVYRTALGLLHIRSVLG